MASEAHTSTPKETVMNIAIKTTVVTATALAFAALGTAAAFAATAHSAQTAHIGSVDGDQISEPIE